MKYKKSIQKLYEIPDHLNKLRDWLIKTFIINNYNFFAVIFAVVTAILIYIFLGLNKTDINHTYYLISISAIYGTILLTYLLQKIAAIKMQKQGLFNTSQGLWSDLNNYRYLCRLLSIYIEQQHHRAVREILELKISIVDLFYLDFNYQNKVDKRHLEEFKHSTYGKDFVLLVKLTDFFGNYPTDAFIAINYINRIYANNNTTINQYIKILIHQGAFHQFELVNSQLQKNEKIGAQEFINRVSKHSQFNYLKAKVAFSEERTIMDYLKGIEIYILNKVLFSLHDDTFIIEKKLPHSFIQLLINAIIILFFGTVLPLANSFVLQNVKVLQVCGAITIGTLLTSLTFLVLSFNDENDDEIFKYNRIVYENKTD